jgi:DNA-binding transcriptional ArsR family regulator
VATTKPTLELLRSLSDEHVLRALIARRRATRAEIAATTGLSKPTISESVRRLERAGAIVDTGERTTGRGRVGTYYALAPTTGCALVASLAPEGIVAEAIDVYGDVVSRAQAPAHGSSAAGRCASSRARARTGSPWSARPIRWIATTGRLVELPDAPFLVGALDPRAVLDGVVEARHGRQRRQLGRSRRSPRA